MARSYKLRLAGQNWTIRYVSRLGRQSGPLRELGDCQGGDRLIRIVSGQGSGDELDTLFHEALHGLAPLHFVVDERPSR